MRILFFADRYGYEFMSIKRVMQEELESRGVEVLYQDKSKIWGVVTLTNELHPDQVWLAHSSLVLPCDKALVKAPVIGFGFGDPHDFSPGRLQSYDGYVTAHYGTYVKYKHIMPVLFSPDPYSPKYFKSMDIDRNMEATCIGRASHLRFINVNERIDYVDRLRRDTHVDIHAYGRGWPEHVDNHSQIVGDELLKVINRSKVGLDIQGCLCSISERVFHYSGCGIPVITRAGQEVEKVFVPGEEIITYEGYAELRDKLKYYMGTPALLVKIGKAAQARCLAEHTVAHRIDNILEFVEGKVA